MFRFVVIYAVLFSVALGGIAQSAINPRIVNGVSTTIDVHPYQVSLQAGERGHFCGGSLINKNTILTAAHCYYLRNISDVSAYLGSSDWTTGGVSVNVTIAILHPNFVRKTYENDVALYKLAQDVPESANIRYIELAEVAPIDGTPAVVSGWGVQCVKCKDSPLLLQMITVSIVTVNECASNKYKYGSQRIFGAMICAYELGKDSCQGDSGGPMVADGKLVGVVSFGEGCGLKDYPGIYADVAALKSWILQNSA